MERKVKWRCVFCGAVEESQIEPGKCDECDARLFAKTTAVALTRPTADLGEDGELVEALGDVLDIIAAAQAEFSRTDEHKAYYNKRHEQVQQARDRLILYREARDRFCEIIARAERDGFTPEIEQVLIDLSRSGG